MSTIQPAPIPPHALLHKYASLLAAYTDCYTTALPVPISFADYLFAFYTTPLFKLERLILGLSVRKPSTDAEARALANGLRASFAAWTVEARAEDQILMCDVSGRTRSWLLAVPEERGTRLYFGSAVVPVTNPRTSQASLGPIFNALLGFHKLYSISLLWAASLRLRRLQRGKARA